MQRQQQRLRWLESLGLGDKTITSLPADASSRRYFRIADGARDLILMDAPGAPANPENPGQFIKVTHYLKQLGVRVPEIIAAQQDAGFVLLEDLGNQTMTALLAKPDSTASAQSALYRKAIAELESMQRAFALQQREIALPPYDFETCVDEALLFVNWYLSTRRQQKISATDRNQFCQIWQQLYDAMPTLPPVLVHRDYHVDNLLLVQDRCAMLDYQDALIGSPAYDVVSLLEDARRDLAPSLRANLLEGWLQKHAGRRQQLLAHYRFWGAQRHCKVAGIFVRLWKRDGKPGYLQHIPRVMHLLAQQLQHPSMQALKIWIENRI